MNAALIPEASAAGPPPERESAATGAERRRHERLDFRTVVVAIVQTADGLRYVRCQTDDLSFEGARLVCFEPLDAQAVYLRILMPGLSERFVEAQIANQRVHSELRFGVGVEYRYIYGVRFRRVVTDPELLARLRATADPPPQADRGAGI